MSEPRTPITFFVPGVPAPGGSKHAMSHKHTGRIIVKEDCKRTPGWRACVWLAARDTFRGDPLTGPLSLSVEFRLPRGKGHFGSGRNAGALKPSAPERHTVKPDATKLLRALEDALTGLCWRDDAQICEQRVTKAWTNGTPGAQVTIRELPAPAGGGGGGA